MIEVVEFANGKYGIRKRSWLQRLLNYGGKYYSAGLNRFAWSDERDVVTYCLFDTYEKAVEQYKNQNVSVKRIVNKLTPCSTASKPPGRC